MTAPVAFTIVGEPRAALLSRLLGFFSQHELCAPDLSVTREGEDMIVRLVSHDLGVQLGRIVSAKMESLVGVRHVDLTFPEEVGWRASGLALEVPA